jgi:hypothetical protein
MAQFKLDDNGWGDPVPNDWTPPTGAWGDKPVPTPKTDPLPTLPKPGGDGGVYGTEPVPFPTDATANPWAANPFAPTAPAPQAPWAARTKPTQSAADWIKAYQAAHPVSEGISPITAAMKAAGYNVSPYMYGATPSGNELSLDGQKYKILGAENSPGAYWYSAGQNDGGGGGGTNPFDDPATKPYIDQLMRRIQQLETPQANPQMDALQTYLKKYFEQLQGPTYTPQQQDTIHTQALDPLQRQRQQELKQVAQTMASRGITPGSGPYLQAERDINQKFDSLGAQTQGGLALNEINQGRQDASKAVDVGSANASLTNGQFLQQDARANQAVSLGRQVPDLAAQRMQTAIQMLNGSNQDKSNASLLSALQGFQHNDQTQNTADSQYWSNLIALLAKQFGL